MPSVDEPVPPPCRLTTGQGERRGRGRHLVRVSRDGSVRAGATVSARGAIDAAVVAPDGTAYESTLDTSEPDAHTRPVRPPRADALRHWSWPVVARRRAIAAPSNRCLRRSAWRAQDRRPYTAWAPGTPKARARPLRHAPTGFVLGKRTCLGSGGHKPSRHRSNTTMRGTSPRFAVGRSDRHDLPGACHPGQRAVNGRRVRQAAMRTRPPRPPRRPPA